MKIAVIDDSEQDLSIAVDYFKNYISNYHYGLYDNLTINNFPNTAFFLTFFEIIKCDSQIYIHKNADYLRSIFFVYIYQFFSYSIIFSKVLI